MTIESPFSNIPNQFDSIPDKVPVIFISYSWDSEEHKQWVLQLSKDLREKYRVYTLLDRYNRGGYDVVTFMRKGLKRADRVLIIGTPKYKEKLETAEGGGAKLEDTIISNSIYKEIESSKYIPVLREGKFTESFSELIETRIGYDLRNDAQYEEHLQELAADLWGTPMNTAPELGPRPNFTPAANTIQHLVASSPMDFANIVKTYLLDPSKEIVLTELIEDEMLKAYNKIQATASYGHVLSPAEFSKLRSVHNEAAASLISAMLPIVRYGSNKQFGILVNAMTRLCMQPIINGQITVEGMQYAHLLASSFLFHASGLACVKYNSFDMILQLMQAQVTAPNVLSLNYSVSLDFLAGCNHWNNDGLCGLLNATWLSPYSQLILAEIRPYFDKVFFDDNDYQNTYFTWEHLASLLCNFHGNHIGRDDWFPYGAFVRKRFSLFRNEDDFYTRFFKSASEMKDEWPPIKQGLFEGKYTNFENTYNLGEAFFKRVGFQY